MYDMHRTEIQMTSGTSVIDCTSTGDKARWSPLFYQAVVRAMAVVSNATPGDAGVIKADLRPTFGSDSSRTDGTVATINIATTHVAGKVVYHYPASPVTVSPGQEVVIEVTDASASLNGAKISLIVEWVYDTVGNNTAMVATT